MSLEILFIFALIGLAVVLFVWERVSFDVTAVILLSALLLTGILTPEEGFSGFSNPATITIGAMFVLSEGLYRTGALNGVGDYFGRLGAQSPRRAVFIMMAIVAVLSMFINNTAVVAIFIPIIMGVAAERSLSASRLLMPLSFASMLGGVCTLIGTSTNILVSSIATDYGLEPFGMFEFAPLGLVLLVCGFAYLFLGGIRLIPERRTGEDLAGSFEMNAYLTDVVLEPEFAHLGRPLDADRLTRDLDLDVVQLFKDDEAFDVHTPEVVLEAGDVLRIRGNAREIQKLLDREDLSLLPAKAWYDVDLRQGRHTLVEAVVAPDSALEGKTIRRVHLDERFGALVLAIRQRGALRQEALGQVRIAGGDSLLLTLDADRTQEIEQDPSFVLVSEVGIQRFRSNKTPLAIAILAGVVGTAALDVLPIVVSAVTGGLLLVLTGCLTTEEAYRAINWKIIFLLAGVLPLGLAMEKTGAADLLSNSVITAVGSWGPTAVLSGFFLLSMLLTNVISNQATAVLLAPIAIETAGLLEVSPHPLLIAVTFAASLSFMTPVGYQTNTLIYGPGQYRFTDFTKIGAPLNALLWVLATFLIPVFWPF